MPHRLSVPVRVGERFAPERWPDTADELTKLADLRNRWMLTQTELEAQEAQLPGRRMQS